MEEKLKILAESEFICFQFHSPFRWKNKLFYKQHSPQNEKKKKKTVPDLKATIYSAVYIRLTNVADHLNPNQPFPLPSPPDSVRTVDNTIMLFYEIAQVDIRLLTSQLWTRINFLFSFKQACFSAYTNWHNVPRPQTTTLRGVVGGGRVERYFFPLMNKTQGR